MLGQATSNGLHPLQPCTVGGCPSGDTQAIRSMDLVRAHQGDAVVASFAMTYIRETKRTPMAFEHIDCSTPPVAVGVGLSH